MRSASFRYKVGDRVTVYHEVVTFGEVISRWAETGGADCDLVPYYLVQLLARNGRTAVMKEIPR